MPLHWACNVNTKGTAKIVSNLQVIDNGNVDFIDHGSMRFLSDLWPKIQRKYPFTKAYKFFIFKMTNNDGIGHSVGVRFETHAENIWKKKKTLGE